MPRGFNNWSAADVIKFLQRHRFAYSHTRGSHFYYVGAVGGRSRLACVPVHGRSSIIHPKTLKGIIRQSGLSEGEWRSGD